MNRHETSMKAQWTRMQLAQTTMTLPWHFHWISMTLPWCFDYTSMDSMEIPWPFHATAVTLPLNFHKCPWNVFWKFHGRVMEVSRNFYSTRSFMEAQWKVRGRSWEFQGIFMNVSWNGVCRTFTEVPWKLLGSVMKVWWKINRHLCTFRGRPWKLASAYRHQSTSTQECVPPPLGHYTQTTQCFVLCGTTVGVKSEDFVSLTEYAHKAYLHLCRAVKRGNYRGPIIGLCCVSPPLRPVAILTRASTSRLGCEGPLETPRQPPVRQASV